MKNVRLAVSLIGVLLVVGGYFASQYAYFFGDPTQYSKAVDASQIPYLALFVLLMCVIFLLIPTEEAPE